MLIYVQNETTTEVREFVALSEGNLLSAGAVLSVRLTVSWAWELLESILR